MKTRRIALSFIVLSLLCAISYGQRTAYTQNTADLTLRSTGRVNPSTLGMEMQIPLSGYPGRGGGTSINLSYSSKLWRLDAYFGYQVSGGGFFRSYNRVQYAEDSASGWTVSTAAPFIEYTGEADFYDYLGDHISINCLNCPPSDPYTHYIRRLTFHSPDGGSHELRPDDAPHLIDRANIVYDWNGTFHAVDGSKLRYVETASSFVLWMPDGSYYTFGPREERSNGRDAIRRAVSHTDNNGNTIYYNQPAAGSPNGSTTDTMGRTIANVLPQEKPLVPVVQSFALPGMSQPYKFYWKKLKDTTPEESALTNFGLALNFAGDKICQGPDSPSVSPSLFASSSEAWTCATSTADYFNPVLLTKIELPNGQAYRFSYDIYGEIDGIYYPTGGEEHFEYSGVPTLKDTYPPYDTVNRGVTKRQVYETSTGTPMEWTYSADNGYHPNPIGPYTATVTNPNGTKGVRYLRRSGQAEHDNYGYNSTLDGMAFEERTLNAAEQVTARKVTNWQETLLSYNAYRHPRVASEVSFIYEPGAASGLTSSVTYEYDGDTNAPDCPLNVIRVTERGFEVVPATPPTVSENQQIYPSNATPAKIIETDYLYDANYQARNISGLVTETRIKDAIGIVKAKSQIDYDQTNYLEGVTVTNAPGWENPNTSYRGLPTIMRSWSDIGANQYVETKASYDQFGNVRKTWDGRGNVSEVQYNDNFSDGVNRYTYAFPTKTISADPDGNGSGTSLESTVKYDFNTGLTTSSIDPNGLEARMEYNDALLRPTRVSTWYNNSQVGGETITEYGAGSSDTTRFVKVRSQIDIDKWKESYSWFDGLGRTIRSQSVDGGSGDVFVLSCYDNMGRVAKATNPFRGYTNQDCSTTTGLEWTTNTFDTAGRPWKVTTPDGAVVETTYGLATSGTHIGTVVTVKDQAEKLRRSITNALGHLTRVDEPNNAGQLGAIDVPNQPTLYTYDPLNNLSTVQQNGTGTEQCGPSGGTCAQTRTFLYDSLSRLKSATNPESGTISYGYDLNGNLTSKIDARGVKTDYVYDALNRVTNRNYSLTGATPPNYQATPDVTYTYDNLTNSKGKVTKIDSSVSTTDFTEFDILGRVTKSKQTTDGVTYGNGSTDSYMTYGYNLSGALVEQQYPSGRKVKNVLDNDGYLETVNSRKNATSGYWAYAGNFTYNAAGAVTSMQLGNGHWESTVFNNRLQPTQIALGVIQNATNILDLDYSYGTTANNGNILSQTITVPTVTGGTGFTAIQTYTYDSLNRLDDAVETISSTQTWRQDFSYDRYGNRNFVEGNTSFAGFDKLCNGNTELCTDLRKRLNPSISTSTNRINTSEGYAFDASGNTTSDPDDRTFIYDGENKQVKVLDTNDNVVGEYFYDGEGKRVKKVVPATGETTIFVYDAAGKQIAEYSTIVQTGSNAQVAYTTNDHLGSPRINTNAAGNVIARHDYHPFGEEVLTTARTNHAEYAGDTIRKKFTGYERDGETDLDFAQARYHSSIHGRFQSPDPILISITRVVNPQIWNGYSYVGNNPLRFVDPLGLEKIQLNDTEEQIKKKKEAEKLKKEALIAEKNALKKSKAARADIEAKQKEIDGVNDTMSAMDRKMAATRVVQKMLDALDEVGERNGLQLSDFTVSTDPRKDYASEGQTFVNKLVGSEAIAITDAAGAKMIIINAENSSAFYSQITNFADPNSGLYVYKGAAIARHEQRHNQGGNENAAYTTERAVFNKFRPKFLNNLPLYDALDRVIANGIANNP